VAREQIREELPQVAIEVLDSQTACAAEGLIVLAAARAAAKGKKLDEIIKIAEGVRERMNLIVLMETIRHVYRTGRIPKAAAEIGSMLKVKPILTVPDGAAHLAGMVRTQDSGVKRMLAMMRKKVGTSPVHVAVTHANALEEGKKLKEQISSEFNCVDLWLTEFSPIMGYATGPGVLGVAFYSED
jgi:DegV family protein with EDD domain